MNWINKLITNNTGYSSKNFALVVAVIIVVFVILNVFGLLWVDLLNSQLSISSDMFALAAIITAAFSVLGYLLKKKVDSEKK